ALGQSEQDRVILLFIPLGSKVVSITQNDQIVQSTSFVDFGKSGYSFVVPGKTDATLKLEYTLSGSLQFTDNSSMYNFYLQKQPGEGSGHFSQTIGLADNLKFTDKTNT